METIEDKGWDFRLLFEYRKSERGREREVKRWRERGSGTMVGARERERWRDRYGGDVGESREEGEVFSSIGKEG